jgi:hypothetical protein
MSGVRLRRFFTCPHVSAKPEILHHSREDLTAGFGPRFNGLDLTPLQIKQTLIAAGLEVYRTTGEEVIVADRVRDNLILDSGVRVRAGEPMEVRLIMGVRRGQYPNDSDDQLFARLRQLASPAVVRGFAESQTGTAPVSDPADAKRTLDTFFELVLVKHEENTTAMLDLVRFAVEIAQTAESRH